MELQEVIKSIDFFKSLNTHEIELLLKFSHIKTFNKDSIIYYESENDNSLLFLVEGLIKVYKLDKFNNEIFLYYIKENTLISEISSIEKFKIHCFSNTICLQDSKILYIDYEEFTKNFIDTNILTKELIEEILKKTAQLQCILNRELVYDATAKVAHMLYNDLKMFNKLKRQEVSLMLHIQPETLSRVLKRLVRSEIIDIENNFVLVKKPNGLIDIFRGESL